MPYFPKPSLNENDLAIIERGATAAHSIEAGKYVSWHGRTGKAKAAILQGATLSESLFDYDEDGALNKVIVIAYGSYSANPTNITIQEDGLYLVYFTTYYSSGQYIGIKKNGTITFRASLDGAGGTKVCAGILPLTKNDVIAFYVEGSTYNDTKFNRYFILRVG